MSSYAENAAARERVGRKKRQDVYLDKVTKSCDADVVANTDKRGGWKRMKYERESFTVVTASAAYRKGWDRTFGGGGTDAKNSPIEVYATEEDAGRRASVESTDAESAYNASRQY